MGGSVTRERLTDAAKKIRRHKAKAPVYLVLRRARVLMDDGTAREAKGWFASSVWDQEIMTERKYQRGDIVRAVLDKPRDESFHRRVHLIGRFLADNVEAFHGMKSHDVIKQLQREANAFCDEVRAELDDGTPVTIRMAQSIAYDDMDDGDFKLLSRQIIDHVCAKHMDTLTPEVFEEMLQLYERSKQA